MHIPQLLTEMEKATVEIHTVEERLAKVKESLAATPYKSDRLNNLEGYVRKAAECVEQALHWVRTGTPHVGDFYNEAWPGHNLPESVKVGPDGKCLCSCADKCPLGKTGTRERCTALELAAQGVNMVAAKE